MLLSTDSGAATFGWRLSLSEFPRLVTRHLEVVRGTREIEAAADALVRADFPDTDLTKFVSRVCMRGGYGAIAGRILRDNTLSDIRLALQGALAELDAPIPDLASALKHINAVKGLGTPSFASKHLRFLRPAVCPVLDSFVAGSLGYAFTPSGYARLGSDCQAVAASLKSLGLLNPMRDSDEWLVGDVDMVLFAGLQESAEPKARGWP